MVQGTKQITGVLILEELQMVELELEYNSSLRKRIDTLIRLIVQDLTVECLTIERLAWLIRPLLEGKHDSEERIIRARMKPSVEEIEKVLNNLGKNRYDRVPLGLVGSARQIIQTGAAYGLLYKREDQTDQQSQTDVQAEIIPEADQEQDSLDRYFEENNSTCSEEC